MSRRATLLLEQGEILEHHAHSGDQWVLRVHAPRTAARARPGQFAHIRVDDCLPMRRPLSLMRAEPDGGWVEFLYKVVGEGTARLARRRPGESLSLIAPIGRPFEVHLSHPRPLLIGGGVGIPPMVFLADRLRREPGWWPLALLSSEVPFPFTPRPSQILVDGMPDGVIAAMPLLEDWGIPSRLASLQGFPGCYDGYPTDLARHYLDALAPERRREVEVFACGPHPMLEAVARLAQDYGLPAQVALEEFMACGVGGCAGCVVPVHTPAGVQMQRVCVDGPVFDAHAVFPPV